MKEQKENKVNIIGAGLAGLTAAITLAENGIPSRLISLQASERAQSVMAEGGINGALNTMGEEDCTENHFQDTVRSGCGLADEEAVRGLTGAAPDVICWLRSLGVPFQQNPDGTLMQRNFGGQKKKRTAFAKSSTGKVIMTALIDAARRYEAEGLIERFCHHRFLRLLLAEDGCGRFDERIGSGTASENGKMGGFSCFSKDGSGGSAKMAGNDAISADETKAALGILAEDIYGGELLAMAGPVLLAYGGLNGIFPQRTTGTTANDGTAAAQVFSQGVVFSNLEMIQYHPTTIGIPGKRCLVSEAARGEGGRLYILRDGKPWYFMEEKYPELGNLMPRDVVSREIYFALHEESTGDQVYLDMTGLFKETWEKKLPDLREEIRHYLKLDPADVPVPVEPGIHYFMGGIEVDARHRTNVAGLTAAGECCSQYHGANRLGGNSLLGAVYGGRTAAESLLQEYRGGRNWEAGSMPIFSVCAREESPDSHKWEETVWEESVAREAERLGIPCKPGTEENRKSVEPRILADKTMVEETAAILLDALGIVRDGETLQKALDQIEAKISENQDAPQNLPHLFLARAMIGSALERKESRGAHYRTDYPETEEAFCHRILAKCLDA